MFDTILVPHDGSSYSEGAVKLAGEIARKVGASKIVVLQVWPAPFPAASVPLMGSTDTPDTSPELEKAKEILGKGIPAVYRIKRGLPADVILQEVIDLGADLVVMGSRGITGFEGLLLGSVSSKVAQLSKAPVLLAR